MTVPPLSTELPSPRQLRRATVVVLVLAVLIVVGVVLPAERGVDPTGFGRLTGLQEMGEMKMEYARTHPDTARARR